MTVNAHHTTRRRPRRARAAGVLLVVVGALAAAAPASPAAQTAPTYAARIAPILDAHCVTCHRPGGLAPFSLATFADARSQADRIAAVMADGTMPPWKPRPRTPDPFVGQPDLTDADAALVARWADAGAPEGDPDRRPPAPTFEDGWPLGEPDLVVAMPAAYPLAAGATIDHRNFVLPVDLPERRWIRAFDVRPGDGARALIRRARLRLDADRDGREADARDDAPGYPGVVLDHGHFPPGQFLVWAPGQTPEPLARDLPWALDPGTDLILQLALQPAARATAVRAEVGLYFAADAPAVSPVGVVLSSKTLDIPPGEPAYLARDRYITPVAIDVLGLYPYMHHRGREVEVTAELPDGTPLDLLTIDDWDFDWQDGYRYTAPVHLPAGTTLNARFLFDNSSSHPRHPSDAPGPVRYGPTLADEMAEVLLQVLPTGGPADGDALVRHLQLKQLSNDILGFQARLRHTPDDPVTHNDLAVRYLDVGQRDLAREHLARAMELDPGFAEPHFNLGSLLVAEGDTDGAILAFRRAISIAPNYAEAHNNLGALLATNGLLDEAITYYRLALQFDPRDARAHYNIANALLGRGDRAGAEEHYRAALAEAPDDTGIHTNLARTLAADHQLAAAVEHYQRALALEPDLAAALIGLAWIRATAPEAELRRSAEALTLAEQTVRLVGAEHPQVLDTLAAAYASAGRFDDAIATGRKAADAARTTPGFEAAAASIDARVMLYLAFKPFRTAPPEP